MLLQAALTVFMEHMHMAAVIAGTAECLAGIIKFAATGQLNTLRQFATICLSEQLLAMCMQVQCLRGNLSSCNPLVAQWIIAAC